MPTYQYACTECDHAFDQAQAFSDDSLTVCPECQGKLRKIFNAVGVVFKGSGFYRTDSRADSKPATSEVSTTTKKSESSPDSGSSTAKSDSNSTSKPAESTSKPKADSTSAA